MKRRVAFTMRVTEAPNYHEPRDSISHDWMALCRSWGFEPLLVPNLGPDATGYLTGHAVDLLVLTGGEDFGRNALRDETELALLDCALERGLPVLGVCRGMQIANHRFGGADVGVKGHVAVDHDLAVEAPFSALFGATFRTNSYHERGIEAGGLAAGFKAWALDAEGHVEGCCHDDHALAGIMWHPERNRLEDGDRALMDQLIEHGRFWK